jgi:hypothetical protein
MDVIFSSLRHKIQNPNSLFSLYNAVRLGKIYMITNETSETAAVLRRNKENNIVKSVRCNMSHHFLKVGMRHAILTHCRRFPGK